LLLLNGKGTFFFSQSRLSLCRAAFILFITFCLFLQLPQRSPKPIPPLYSAIHRFSLL
jgi:hypothetical protein